LLENIPEFATEKYIKEWTEVNGSTQLERIIIEKHSLTMKNLGRAVIQFASSLGAQSAVRQLDQKKCLGNLISARLLKPECDSLDKGKDSTTGLEGSITESQSIQGDLEKLKIAKVDLNEAKPSSRHQDVSKNRVGIFIYLVHRTLL
jgi:hypothetical protein